MSANDAEAMTVNLLPGDSAQVRQMVRWSPSHKRPSRQSHGGSILTYWHNCTNLFKQSGLEVAALRSFAFACEPYFTFLESTARTMQLPPDMFVQLMEFSQQMCDTLEHLVLTFASNNLLTLDESEPDNMSHFCIGRIELDQLQLSVTAFRYCKPTPYLARINTGVFKRMRWNVKHLNGAKDGDGNPEIEYYFLCYEDILNLHTDDDNPDSKTLRMWSIGQWVQLKPDPNSKTIFDWLECEVPEGAFEKLLFMGSQEPSSYTATEHLLQLLMSSVISVGNTSGVPRMV